MHEGVLLMRDLMPGGASFQHEGFASLVRLLKCNTRLYKVMILTTGYVATFPKSFPQLSPSMMMTSSPPLNFSPIFLPCPPDPPDQCSQLTPPPLLCHLQSETILKDSTGLCGTTLYPGNMRWGIMQERRGCKKESEVGESRCSF